MKKYKIHHTWVLLIASALARPFLAKKWTPQGAGIFPPLYTVTELDAVNETTVWATVDAFPWTLTPTGSAWIVRTTDGGANWQYLQIPGAAGYTAWCIDGVSRDTAWVSMSYQWDGRNKSRIYRTTDGGKTWEVKFQGRAAGWNVHFFDTQNGVITRGNLFRYSSDGGNTWSALDTIATANDGLLSPQAFDVKGDTIWHMAFDGKVARSINKGRTWQAFNTPLVGTNTFLHMIAFSDARRGLAVAGFSNTPEANGYYFGIGTSRLFRTEDGGATWLEIPRHQLPASAPQDQDRAFFIGSIAAVPGTNSFLITDRYFTYNQETFEQKSFDRTFLSRDGGNGWELLDNSENIGIGALTFISPTVGWAGSDAVLPGAAINAYFAKWNGGTLTGTKDKSFPDLNVHLFPNPATNEISLKLPETPLKNITIELIDMYGKVVQTNTDFNQPFNIKNLPEGMYLAVVRAGEQVLAVRKWVKVE